MAASLKLQIIVCSLSLSLSLLCSLQVHSGSLKGIAYSKQYRLVFTALEKINFIFSIVVTAAGVVPCGGPKKQPHTSSIVQFIVNFWSFEISGNILRNRKILKVRLKYSNQICAILTPFGFISVFGLTTSVILEIIV